MDRWLTAGDEQLLGHVFCRVKRMITKAVEDGECALEEAPDDGSIAEILSRLYKSGRFDLLTLEDSVFESLLDNGSRHVASA